MDTTKDALIEEQKKAIEKKDAEIKQLIEDVETWKRISNGYEEKMKVAEGKIQALKQLIDVL